MSSKSDSHFRQDLESIVPDNIPELPVGTLEEIQKEGMDPAHVPSCHKRVINGGVVEIKGCPYAVPGMNDVCRLTARGVSGPHFYGVQYLKGKVHGGGMVRGVRDCFYIARFKQNAETVENGGSIEIVADEGEKFAVVQAGPPDYLDKRVEIEVPRFPRPGENPELVKEQLKAEVRAEAERKRVQAQHDRNVGGLSGKAAKIAGPKP